MAAGVRSDVLRNSGAPETQNSGVSFVWILPVEEQLLIRGSSLSQLSFKSASSVCFSTLCVVSVFQGSGGGVSNPIPAFTEWDPAQQ